MQSFARATGGDSLEACDNVLALPCRAAVARRMQFHIFKLPRNRKPARRALGRLRPRGRRHALFPRVLRKRRRRADTHDHKGRLHHRRHGAHKKLLVAGGYILSPRRAHSAWRGRGAREHRGLPRVFLPFTGTAHRHPAVYRQGRHGGTGRAGNRQRLPLYF